MRSCRVLCGMLFSSVALGVIALGTSVMSAQAKADASTSEKASIAAGIMRMQQWYDPATGLYRTTGWWNSANALIVLISYERLTGDHTYDPVIANTFVKAQQKFPSFLNDFYDDEGWWALAWLDAYELTGRSRYLHASHVIFEDMTHGWSESPCGGGLWWSKKRDYKNSIPNELFLVLAARLARLDAGAQDRDRAQMWARREWNWFAQTGLINPDHLVNDGLRVKPNGSCENNGQTPWTYNQGAILAGLASLSAITHDPVEMQTADTIAHAAIQDLTTKAGVLKESCEPDCGVDGTQFKGIFARNLRYLAKVHRDAAYSEFLDRNAESLLLHAHNSDATFGQVWSGPPLPANASTQASALDLLLAADSLREQY